MSGQRNNDINIHTYEKNNKETYKTQKTSNIIFICEITVIENEEKNLLCIFGSVPMM